MDRVRTGVGQAARARRALVVVALAALIGGMWAGLARIGWDLPEGGRHLSREHGALMVSGFVGTLITLERAVALGHPAAYLAPGASALAAIFLLADLNREAAQGLSIAAAAGLIAIFAALMAQRRRSLDLGIMAVGAACWLIGNALWAADWRIGRLLPWWIGFLTLTVAGERLELTSMFRRPAGSRAAMVGAMGVLLMGLIISVKEQRLGVEIAGTALGLIALWLLTQDVARRVRRQQGVGRFMAATLLLSYLWLGAAGGLWWVAGAAEFGPRYDAAIHAFFLGFVATAIIAHAPIILPAITGLTIGFSRCLYLPPALLAGSLALRVAADLERWQPGREWGGLLNAIALTLVLLCTAWGVWRGSRLAPRRAFDERAAVL